MAVAISGAGGNTLLAQNYELSPGDSIVAGAQFDDLTVYNILQNNISADTLLMSWQKVSANVPAGWEALICDNNNCYADLKENGVMHAVPVGEYAFLSIHISPHTNSGTALIRYVVWETNNPQSNDTLTWIISSGLTGIGNQTAVPASFLLSGNNLIIPNGKEDQVVRIANVQGQVLLEKKLTSVSTTIDIAHYPHGIYLVVLQGENFRITKKLFFQ